MKIFRILAALAALLAGDAARAQAVVVVGQKSAIESLTANDVSAIFMNKVQTFPNGKAATPLNFRKTSESFKVRVDFEQTVLDKNPSQMQAYWSRTLFTGTGKAPKEVDSLAALKSLLESDPTAIGYVDQGSVDSSMRVVFKR